MTDTTELEAALARAHAAEAKVEDLEIRLGLRPPLPAPRDVVRPSRFVVERGADDLAISWRWNPSFFFVTFALIWNGMLAVACADIGAAVVTSWKALFVVPFVIVGIVTAGYALASLINTTTIRTRDRRVEVIEGPIKVRARRDPLATAEIRQLHAVRHVREDGPSVYSLDAVLRDERRRTLVGDLTDDESRFLEVVLEEHLGIENAST